MAFYAAPLENLIERLCGLPGIGPKSAQRMAFFILSIPRDDAVELARAIVEVKDKVRFCSTCFNISEGEACSICNDARRDETVICVVEEPRDVIAIERSGRFRGTYHVLGGAISPIDGVGPEELTFRELVGRLRDGKVTELIAATNPNAARSNTAVLPATKAGHAPAMRDATRGSPTEKRCASSRNSICAASRPSPVRPNNSSAVTKDARRSNASTPASSCFGAPMTATLPGRVGFTPSSVPSWSSTWALPPCWPPHPVATAPWARCNWDPSKEPFSRASRRSDHP